MSRRFGRQRWRTTQSIREPGIVRFDVVEQLDDPTRFVLIEVYRTEQDPAQHKETAHYAASHNTVAEMIAERNERQICQRLSRRFRLGDRRWHLSSPRRRGSCSAGGTLAQVAEEDLGWVGTRCWSPAVGRGTPRLLEDFAQHRRDVTRFAVPGEPTIEAVEQGVRQAAAARCDLVIGLGGGSVLDAAKAIAALLTNGGHPLDYVEVMGAGQSIPCPGGADDRDSDHRRHRLGSNPKCRIGVPGTSREGQACAAS